MSREVGTLWYDNYTRIGQDFKTCPPMVVEVPPEVLARMNQNATAAYLPNTNIVLVSSRRDQLSGELSGKSMLTEIVTHELVHYMNFLTCGEMMTFVSRGANGRRSEVTEESSNLLEEGFTNYVTNLVLPSLDRSCWSHRMLGYSFETASMALISELVGSSVLIEAGCSGDWRNVQRIIDGRLGEGTFELLYRSNNGAEMYNNLVEKIGNANPPMNLADLERNPIFQRVRLTWESIEANRTLRSELLDK